MNPAAAEALGYRVGGNVVQTHERHRSAGGCRHTLPDYLTRIAHSGEDFGLFCVLHRDGSQRIWKYHNRVLRATPRARRLSWGMRKTLRSAVWTSIVCASNRQNLKQLPMDHPLGCFALRRMEVLLTSIAHSNASSGNARARPLAPAGLACFIRKTASR